MAVTQMIEVVRKECNAENGHWGLELRIVEDDGAGSELKGPTKTYGIDSESLISTFSGDIKAFIESKREELIRTFNGWKLSTLDQTIQAGHRL